MPKLKTNRGAAKRFKQTGSGRFRFRRGFRNHILTKKGNKAKAQKRALGVVAKSDEASIKQMLNLGG